MVEREHVCDLHYLDGTIAVIGVKGSANQYGLGLHSDSEVMTNIDTVMSLKRWPQRLRHLSVNTIKTMVENNFVSCMSFSKEKFFFVENEMTESEDQTSDERAHYETSNDSDTSVQQIGESLSESDMDFQPDFLDKLDKFIQTFKRKTDANIENIRDDYYLKDNQLHSSIIPTITTKRKPLENIVEVEGCAKVEVRTSTATMQILQLRTIALHMLVLAVTFNI
ncbi:unnamed protein product [Timema podura]|uniref:Uncharacterized protein n=1 Tax=Timema podura TaxID=61482 RepID=A0ABN7NNV4_TIMPD|nr:unnamed protein product [Timema podura]